MRLFSAAFLISACCAGAAAQPSPGREDLPSAPEPSSAARSADQREVSLTTLPRHLLEDQEAIWTSPARIRPRTLLWLAPLAGAEAAAIATDHHTLSAVVSHDPGFNQANVNTSNVLIGSLIAFPAGLFGYGYLEQDEHAREAGILGSESILDGVVVEQGIKLIAWRERPSSHDARGHFWQSSAGVDSSFPSSHAVLAWSAASALAGEYSAPWQQAGLYGVASAISLTRILGQQHFPGDVLAGSVAGWMIGRYVFRAHHRRLPHQ